MEPEEKIKIELEVPKKDIKVESVSSEPSVSKKPKEDKKQETENTIAGYKPSEIAKAPLEPPKPEDKKGPSRRQKFGVIAGSALVAAGLILWPFFNFAIFICAAFAGAAIVAFSSLVRV